MIVFDICLFVCLFVFFVFRERCHSGLIDLPVFSSIVLCCCFLTFVFLCIFNPRLTKGVVSTPLQFFSSSFKTLKESYQGHLGNLFYILCGHFHEKKIGGTTLPGGRVSRQSQRVRGLMQPFQVLENRKIAILKNICILWRWNLQKMLELPFFFCISKKTNRWNSDIQNFYSEILNFAYLTQKVAI